MRVRDDFTFGELLKFLRRSKHMTQEELASLSSYSVSYISKLESGKRKPVITTSKILAASLALNDDEYALLIKAAGSYQSRKRRARHIQGN